MGLRSVEHAGHSRCSIPSFSRSRRRWWLYGNAHYHSLKQKKDQMLQWTISQWGLELYLDNGRRTQSKDVQFCAISQRNPSFHIWIRRIRLCSGANCVNTSMFWGQLRVPFLSRSIHAWYLVAGQISSHPCALPQSETSISHVDIILIVPLWIG